MTLFWFSTIALIVVSVLFVAIPLIRIKRFNGDLDRNELNKAFYRARLGELQDDIDKGTIDDLGGLINDLEQSLLDDMPLEEKKTSVSEDNLLLVFTFSFLLLVAISYGMYFKFSDIDKVADWNEAVSNLPALTQKLMSSSDEKPLNRDEMEDLKLGLRTQLHKTPNDSSGWLLLGRIALADQQASIASEAFEKAYKNDPEDPNIRFAYARSMIGSTDEYKRGRAKLMLIELLQDNYVDLKIYSLLAFDAYQNQDFPTAVRYWKTMQKMIGHKDPRYTILEGSISNAERHLISL